MISPVYPGFFIDAGHVVAHGESTSHIRTTTQTTTMLALP